MLENLSDHIRDCHARAVESRRRAAETSDPVLKADFEAMETGWLRLAESYAVSERLQEYLLEQDAKVAKRAEWQPAANAPFDRIVEVAVIDGPIPNLLGFPCRRVLGGWVDAETGERIKVHPTHWRHLV